MKILNADFYLKPELWVLTFTAGLFYCYIILPQQR
jgi:hypothetical protein